MPQTQHFDKGKITYQNKLILSNLFLQCWTNICFVRRCFNQCFELAFHYQCILSNIYNFRLLKEL